MDIVFTYVNSADPVWQEQFNNHNTIKSSGGCSNSKSKNRFNAELNEIYYSIKSLLPIKHLIGNIHIVVSSESQIAGNLCLTLFDNIKIITHDMIIPIEYLPTFNS